MSPRLSGIAQNRAGQFKPGFIIGEQVSALAPHALTHVDRQRVVQIE